MNKRENFSFKRNAILEAISNTTEHPSAKMVYEKLKPNYPDLSLGTVYRNISLFKNKGLVSAVANVNGEERIDGNVEPHGHFVCNCCGGVYDVFNEELTADNPLLENEGFIIESYFTTYYGKCNKCS